MHLWASLLIKLLLISCCLTTIKASFSTPAT